MLKELQFDGQINPTVYLSALWWAATVLHVCLFFSVKLFVLLYCLSICPMLFLQLVKLYPPANECLSGNKLEMLQHT
jgi:hypothetical protein